MTPRAAMWVQTRLGLGHFSRAATICGFLAADGFDVTLIHGGAPVQGIRLPTGVRLAQLPVAHAPDLASADMVDVAGRPVNDLWRAKRVAALKAALEDARPDIVLTETFPFGRRLFSFELVPILTWLRSLTPRPLIVSSVRDIVTRPEKAGKADAMVAMAESLYDLLLCHSDPRILRLPDSFPETARLSTLIRHTGYVVGSHGSPQAKRNGVIVVAGGGAVGAALFNCAIAARRQWSRDTGVWTLVAGPRANADALKTWRATAPAGLVVEGAVEGLAERYGGVRLIVAQAGYNTVCEALASGAKLVTSPYATAKETEQTIRAEAFDRMGFLTSIREEDLSPERLQDAMARALDAPAPSTPIDFDGGATTAHFLRQALQERRS